MKRLWIILSLLGYSLQSYAVDSNKVTLYYMSTDAGEVRSIDYQPLPAGNFVSPDVDSNDNIKVSYDTVSRKFKTEGERKGLEIDFQVDRDGVEKDGGDYMVAAFLKRVKSARVGGNYDISFTKVNFIFSGQLSINNSPIKGEIHFMQTEMSDKNEWHLGFNEGVYGGDDLDKGVEVCTKDGNHYHIKHLPDDDNDHEFRVYVTADADKKDC